MHKICSRLGCQDVTGTRELLALRNTARELSWMLRWQQSPMQRKQQQTLQQLRSSLLPGGTWSQQLSGQTVQRSRAWRHNQRQNGTAVMREPSVHISRLVLHS
jgi:hypothetical protein